MENNESVPETHSDDRRLHRMFNDHEYYFVASQPNNRRRRQKEFNKVDHPVAKKQETQKDFSKIDHPDANIQETAACTVLEPIDQLINFAESSHLTNEVSVYKELIIRQKAFTIVSENNSAFIIPGYKNGQLNSDIFVCVKRKILVKEESQSLFSCSCNPYRTRLVQNLPYKVDHFPNDCHEELAECIHISLVTSLINGLDINNEISDLGYKNWAHQRTIEEHNYGATTTQKFEAYLPSWDSTKFCLHEKAENQDYYTIIAVNYKGKLPKLQCLNSECRKFKSENNCKHIKAIQDIALRDIDFCEFLKRGFSQTIKFVGNYIPNVLSTSKIVFANKRVIMPLTDEFYANSDGVCSKCGSDWRTDVELANNIPYFGVYTSKFVKVYHRRCSRCDKIKIFDGCNDNVLNMSSYLVSHDVLRDYLTQYTVEGSTLAAYFKEWACKQFGQDLFNKMTYFKFQHAWYAFKDLLDIEASSAFICPCCGNNPKTIVMDGVCLSLRKSYMPWDKLYSCKQNLLQGSKHSLRVFINNKEIRDLFSLYSTSGLDMDTFQKLKAIINAHKPALNDLIIELEEGNLIENCPKNLKRFFTFISKNYPLSGIIPAKAEILEILRKMSEGDNLEVMEIQQLELECPIIAEMQQFLSQSLKSVMRAFLDLLGNSAHGRKPHELQPCDAECYCGKEEITYLPKLPQLCHRGNYEKDNLKNTQNNQCRKQRLGHPVLAPGLFTISCHHGVCYGYQLLDCPESLDVPFTLMRTRFQTAPKHIIYDNACNLHQYCLNRDPGFFERSRFLVDRLHWKNHSGCHEGYNISLYANLRSVNSQVAEQKNSCLKKLNSMLSYMTLDNFKKHLNLFLWFHNQIAFARNDFQFTCNENDSTFFKNYYRTLASFKSQ